MARGGRRTPAKPAAVSGPGALSQRTDGGPAPAVSSAGGRGYGERKKLEAQEAAAPSGRPSPGPSRPVGAAASPRVPDAFGPTQFPNEPATTGSMGSQTNPLAQNPQAALRVMYQRYPHPAIKRLIDWSNPE
jgi:hypothetical protein